MLHLLMHILFVLQIITPANLALASNTNSKVTETIDQKLEANNEEFVKLANEITKKSNDQQYVQFAKEIVSNVKENQTAKNYTPIPKAANQLTLLDEILADASKIQDAKNSCAPSKSGLYILVSFSMPQEVLLKLDKQARQIGAKLVIRGLINNSFKETVSHIKKLNDQGMVIDIDPRIFADFKVNHVPCFILKGEDQDGHAKFDKLVGNVSLSYVLNSFKTEGDLKNHAINFLQKLAKKDNDDANANANVDGKDHEVKS